jgi:hypothetical protein
MRNVLIVLLLASATPASAQYRDVIIYQASDLVPWCRDAAQARYVARNITPYNWTASYHDRSNILYVDGKLRVHDSDVEVHCRLASGSPLEFATVEINDPGL